jgi:hypothetical protein
VLNNLLQDVLKELKPGPVLNNLLQDVLEELKPGSHVKSLASRHVKTYETDESSK